MTLSTPAVDDAVTVLVYDPAPENYVGMVREHFPGLRVLSADNAESLAKHIPDADVLLAARFPVDFIDKAGRLRWFQSSTAGVDSIMPIRDRIQNLAVTNARGMQGELIADFVIAGMTMLHWDFPRFMREQSRKEWQQREVAPMGERTVGVVGLGAIGTAIARRAKTVGMTVLGTKRDVSEPVVGVDRLLPPEGLSELLQLSDFVVLAVPNIPETARLIDREQLQQMRRSAFLVNIARGSVVAESDLVEALQEGTIAGAFLDVFEREPLPVDSPLWTMPNVIITPHVAGYPTNYTRRVFEIFRDNLQRFLEGLPLNNVVNLQKGY